jgi:ABC-type transport system substrate-binding protein
MFGYKDCDNDGWRELPGCRPLAITYLSATGGASRELNELVVKSAADVGVRIRVENMLFSDLIKARQGGNFQMTGSAWGADYPDAENFMQLLYGPNAPVGNESRFRNREFDRLYEDIATTPDSPARTEKLRQMSRIVAAYAPWYFNAHRVRTHMEQPWVSGYAPHPDLLQHYLYYDIDLAKLAAAKK